MMSFSRVGREFDALVAVMLVKLRGAEMCLNSILKRQVNLVLVMTSNGYGLLEVWWMALERTACHLHDINLAY